MKKQFWIINLIASTLSSGSLTILLHYGFNATNKPIILFTCTAIAFYTISHLVTRKHYTKQLTRTLHLLRQIEDNNPEALNRLNKKTHSKHNHEINQFLFNYIRKKDFKIETLEKLEDYRREFLGNVSHELKTPLFAAQGFVHTLLDGALEDKDVSERFLQKSAKNLDHLQLLIQDLLTISNLESGEIKLNFEHFNISTLTKEIGEDLEDRFKQKNILLTITANTQTIVHADRQRIRQVLLNLINNALKYTNEGEISVTFDTIDKQIVTTIKDTGIGIPPEHIGRIFERFYRVDKSRSKEKGGTGLGLAIVKHVLESHHSSISLKSTPKKGSIFSFPLPSGNF